MKNDEDCDADVSGSKVLSPVTAPPAQQQSASMFTADPDEAMELTIECDVSPPDPPVEITASPADPPVTITTSSRDGAHGHQAVFMSLL